MEVTMKLSNVRKDRASLFRLFMFVGVICCSELPSRADFTVHTGWDLFNTPAHNATFGNQDFQGVSLGSFNFGGSIGIKPVGDTDTIVQRLQNATVSGANQTASAINIELVALQLQSVSQVDFGLGTDFYFITLQSKRGINPSTGQMAITFGPEPQPNVSHGTYDSSFDVFFDMRKGSLTGPIAFSSDLVLSSNDTSWTHVSPPGALLIDQVNHFLKGDGTINQDFWSQPQEQHPSGAMHDPVVATPFEFFPSVGMILFSGLLGLNNLRRKLL